MAFDEARMVRWRLSIPLSIWASLAMRSAAEWCACSPSGGDWSYRDAFHVDVRLRYRLAPVDEQDMSGVFRYNNNGALEPIVLRGFAPGCGGGGVSQMPVTCSLPHLLCLTMPRAGVGSDWRL